MEPAELIERMKNIKVKASVHYPFSMSLSGSFDDVITKVLALSATYGDIQYTVTMPKKEVE